MDNDFKQQVLEQLKKQSEQLQGNQEKLIRIETKLDDYDSIKTKVEEARAKAYSNERRINDIEDKIKWLSRTFLGALIAGVFSIILIFIKMGMGIN